MGEMIRRGLTTGTCLLAEVADIITNAFRRLGERSLLRDFARQDDRTIVRFSHTGSTEA